MQRRIEFSIKEYYHLYNRGVEKRTIFQDDFDRERFMALLYICNGTATVNIRDHLNKGLPLGEIYNANRGKRLVDIGAYCLMPNHYHILVREKIKNGISQFMLKFGTAYTMYFNKKYMRSGGLFGGPFKARHADTDEYLKYLFAYIHLNPLKMIDRNWKVNGIKNIPKAKKYLLKYPFSSYFDYLGKKRIENKILSQSAFPNYFNTKNINRSIDTFEEYITEWLEYSNNHDYKG